MLRNEMQKHEKTQIGKINKCKIYMMSMHQE
jgi:hypothetical protein